MDKSGVRGFVSIVESSSSSSSSREIVVVVSIEYNEMAHKVPSQYSRGICKSLIFDIKSNSGANYKPLVLLLLLKLTMLINGPIESYFE